ncbi:hypothetical protein J4E81_004253 [Alternaria sp. BMP 2799]|nr:hypothetical protein J4E81_004253 [Alternaria sp. BMP 2799]
MPLLDFPPEVFENVAHELVSIAGVGKAWKLRGVCRTFKAAITFDIFAKQSIEAFRPWRSLHTIFSRNLGLYLYYRSKDPLEAQPYLPDRINDMVDYLAEELEITKKSEKEVLRRDLCDKLGHPTSASTVFCALIDEHAYYGDFLSHIPFGEMDKLIAASSLGHHDLVGTVMKSLSNYDPHPVFGSPLERASTDRQIPVLKAMLHHLGTALKDPKQTEEVQELLKAHPFRWRYKKKNGFRLMEVIFRVLERSDLEILTILVTWYKEEGLTFSKAMYNLLLEQAIRESTLIVFQYVLDTAYTSCDRNRSAARITFAQYSIACTHGREDIVELFFDRGYIDPLQTKTTASAMIEGVRSDCIEIVELLLKAGASVNTKSKFNRQDMLPIELAIFKKNPIITQRLIDAGARLPNMKGWPMHEATYEVLRQAKISQDGGKHVLKYKRFKRMSEEDIEKYQAQHKVGAII